MTVRDDILAFLRDPRGFAATVQDEQVWLDGLEFARQTIGDHNDRPLRDAQEAAWRGLAAERAGLILGPPGTGKTHLLSWLITGHSAARTLAQLPARTFVTAFTKNAAGNVLDAVAKRQAQHDPLAPRPVFYGSAPGAGLSADVDVYGNGDEDEVASLIRSGRVVVGGTIWSLNRLLRSGAADGTEGPTAPLFDLICIDEASQMVLGQGLMALAGIAPGGRIVVAGDNQQLPPVRAARDVCIDGRELGGSLYGFLKSTAVAEFALEETFRLNETLASFPERRFYPGRYVSSAKEARLALRPDWSEGLDPLTRAALDPAFPIVVLLHDAPAASTSNPFEASLAAGLIEALADRVVDQAGDAIAPSTFWSETAAVISPHRAQNAAIRTALPTRLTDRAFVETVDRIQGKERDAVVLSYCVADPEFALAEGEFIFSPERLNVATTRAKTKLIVLISRRLLEAVPTDQEVMDKAEILREFIFSCEARADLEVEGPNGRRVRVQVRAQGFPNDTAVLDFTPAPEPEAAELAMTPELQGILDGIRKVAAQDNYQSAMLSKVRKAMALPAEPFQEARDLHGMGWVSIHQRKGSYGSFWTARPYEAARRVYACDLETVRARISTVVRDVRSGPRALYYDVRDRFFWVTQSGGDQFLPLLQTLAAEGLVKLGTAKEHRTVELLEAASAPSEPDLDVPFAALPDDDFRLLNRLEDIEAARINFGVFEAWTSAAELARQAGRAADSTVLALSRLETSGYVMLAEGGNVRSRMAELARELRYVKQRFRSDDADRRPYLVRNLKVELRDRNKPKRNLKLSTVFAAASTKATPSQRQALDGLATALSSLWPANAGLAAFQARGLELGLAAWRGEGPTTLAIAADTGSGKTEAAVLPILAGALADRIEGIEGVRAILAYPRVRLAANQAQRLAAYLAACAQVPGLPQLTLGLQVADVPNSFDSLAAQYQEVWQPAGPDAFGFPFFNCPACGEPLRLHPGAGHAGADALVCSAGDWRFDGWIGSKAQLEARPPSLFLPTTDSLHQWLHTPERGGLFGDDEHYPPPRVLLADEIHLYTHIHGAQVGLALRRLAARAQLNSKEDRPMVAVGMSATIGDPALAWGRLIGRDEVMVIRPDEGEADPNPRGREYFYFVQPEIESRGADIAGASTTIQSLMCLGHGMRRRTGDEGGYRSLVFFDSIDKMRRLHGAYVDAEMGKELARLRTVAYGDDARGQPQTQCCGQPEGCDHFNDGECWWFAANDKRQRGAGGPFPSGAALRVARTPISSGSGGDTEAVVKGSDVVFATSSLEVGYDDPDITLVYQHYAPQNLASFVQRKGRGGRGVDDRPTTAVTLSIYSPRDSWWFRRPHEMVSPAAFTAPLNPDNVFVRRGQALCAVLDGLARVQRRNGEAFTAGIVEPTALREAGVLVERVFGPDVWASFQVADVAAFWSLALAHGSGDPRRGFRELRMGLDWAPDALFDTINLPALTVEGPDVLSGRREDISLALSTVAPGNATRRYNGAVVHWRPPTQGLAPWLSEPDYAHAERQMLDTSLEGLLARLPVEARNELADAHLELCRPLQVTLDRIGWVAGAHWTAEKGYNATRSPPIAPYADGDLPIKHSSTGRLRGFLLVDADPSVGRELDIAPLGGRIASVRLHAGSGADSGPSSGLKTAQVFWGADTELQFDQQGAEPLGIAQTFSDPATGRPLLHGYQVDTEGLQYQVDSGRLDHMVAQVLADLEADGAQRIWIEGQFLRYLVSTGARVGGVNTYDAQCAAELIVAARTDPATGPRLNQLRRFWSAQRLSALFADVRTQILAQNPTMTARRAARAATALADAKFRALIDDCLTHVSDPQRMAGFIRTQVLHSLAIRLKQSVRHIGQGDDRRLLVHVRLPLQFDAIDDVITISESGAHGDGTIREVVEAWDKALAHWSDGFLSDCPNAAEDAALERFWLLADRHQDWRHEDPRNTAALVAIGAEISPNGPPGPPPATVIRILFGTEFVQAETFDLYDVALEIEAARAAARTRIGRTPLNWEIAAAAVAEAASGEAPTLARLHAAYDSLGVAADDSFTPDARLADQVFRLSAPLCFDGCRACVHQSSDVVGDAVLETTVSRRLLSRFICN